MRQGDAGLEARMRDTASGWQAPVVFLTGAGASAAMGLPTMNGFFERMLGEGFTQRLSGPMFPTDEPVWAMLRAAYPDPSTQIYDLERVMATCAAAQHLGDQDSPDVASLAVLALASGDRQIVTHANWSRDVGVWRGYITRAAQYAAEARHTLEEAFHQQFGPVDAAKAWGIWGPLLGALPQDWDRPLPLFTTNYDVAWECMSRHVSDAGLLRLVDGRNHNEATMLWYLDAEVLSQARAKDVVLVKLHGSAHWCEIGGRVALRRIDECVFPAVHQGGPMIRVPVESKGKPDEWWGRAFYASFEEALRGAKTCVAIGMSFRDDYLRGLVDVELRERPDFRLLMVAPNAGEWEQEGNRWVRWMAEEHGNAARCEEYFGKPECTKAIAEFLGWDWKGMMAASIESLGGPSDAEG